MNIHKRFKRGLLRKEATPAAKQLAEEHELDLLTIKGTGKGGKVTKKDVQARIKRIEAEIAALEAKAAQAAKAAKEEE